MSMNKKDAWAVWNCAGRGWIEGWMLPLVGAAIMVLKETFAETDGGVEYDRTVRAPALQYMQELAEFVGPLLQCKNVGGPDAQRSWANMRIKKINAAGQDAKNILTLFRRKPEYRVITDDGIERWYWR